MFISCIREFHDIYFRVHDLDELKLCEFLAHAHNRRSFPFKSTKLKRQVHEMLQSEEEKPIKFYEKLMGTSSESSSTRVPALERQLNQSDCENNNDSSTSSSSSSSDLDELPIADGLATSIGATSNKSANHSRTTSASTSSATAVVSSHSNQRTDITSVKSSSSSSSIHIT